ncbi:MAG: hypothetical protein P8Y74_11925 [Desulfobacterales bacterium]
MTDTFLTPGSLRPPGSSRPTAVGNRVNDENGGRLREACSEFEALLPPRAVLAWPTFFIGNWILRGRTVLRFPAPLNRPAPKTQQATFRAPDAPVTLKF